MRMVLACTFNQE